MNLEEFKEKIKSYSENQIIFSYHAEIRALMREIDLDEVKKNIIDPSRLVFFEEQPYISRFKKYNCYFKYSKELAHRYVFTINEKILIVTIIKINNDWKKVTKRK